MRALLITYDLKQPGQNYKALHERIKGLGLWWHYLESTWIALTSQSPDQAWNTIQPAFDTSDRCLILDVTGDAYQGWLPQEAWDWIHKNVDPVRRC